MQGCDPVQEKQASNSNRAHVGHWSDPVRHRKPSCIHATGTERSLFIFLSEEMSMSWGHSTLIHPVHQHYTSSSTCSSMPAVCHSSACHSQWHAGGGRTSNSLLIRCRQCQGRVLLDCPKCRAIFNFWIHCSACFTGPKAMLQTFKNILSTYLLLILSRGKHLK